MPQTPAATQPTQRPRLAEVAFALVCVAALVALAFAAALPFQIDRVLENQRGLAARQGSSLAELEQQLVLGVVIACAISVVFAALLVVLALRFRAGRRRGRFWIVVLTAVAIAPILFTPATLLTVVVLLVADGLMFLPTVSAWLAASESARSRARLAGLNRR